MGYLNTAQITISMDDMGTDNNGLAFYVKIQNPKLLTWPQKMESAKFAVPEGKVLTPEETKEQLKQMQEYVFGFIKGWNLIDIETEQPLTLDSPAVLDRVPSEVVERILGAFKKNQEKQAEETKN